MNYVDLGKKPSLTWAAVCIHLNLGEGFSIFLIPEMFDDQNPKNTFLGTNMCQVSFEDGFPFTSFHQGGI